MSKLQNNISIGLIIGMVILLIIYCIILFETYKTQTFIFSPYKQVPLPNSFHPLGTITKMSAEQIKFRNEVIAAALAGSG